MDVSRSSDGLLHHFEADIKLSQWLADGFLSNVAQTSQPQEVKS